MMIKLIASDMDGTLLKEDHTIPKSFDLIFNKLQEQNILFCAASGRQYDSLSEYFQKYKDKMCFIAENGAHIVTPEEEIILDFLDKKQIKSIIKVCEKIPESWFILCGKNGAYLKCSDEEIKSFFARYYPNFQSVTDLENIDDIIFKVAIYDRLGARENSFPYLKNLENLKVTISSENTLDISKTSINKGKAIEILQQKLNISYEETMVFGDFLNDLEMMQQAQYSYAMKNAAPEVIAVSNYVTGYSNTDEGVIKTIQKVLNI